MVCIRTSLFLSWGGVFTRFFVEGFCFESYDRNVAKVNCEKVTFRDIESPCHFITTSEILIPERKIGRDDMPPRWLAPPRSAVLAAYRARRGE